MAFDEKLVDRIRESLVDIKKVEEKNMFGGVCFMVNGSSTSASPAMRR